MAGFLNLASEKGIMEPWEESAEGKGLVGQAPIAVSIPRAVSPLYSGQAFYLLNRRRAVAAFREATLWPHSQRLGPESVPEAH